MGVTHATAIQDKSIPLVFSGPHSFPVLAWQVCIIHRWPQPRLDETRSPEQLTLKF